MSEFYERFKKAMERENARTLRAMKDMVVIEEAGEFTEEMWKSLERVSDSKFSVTYGGCHSGKTANMLQKIAAKYIAIDYGVKEGSVGAVWSSDKDGNITVREILAEDFWVKPEAPAPAKKAEKPADFFPSKVGRIAKMPRYPGTWG